MRNAVLTALIALVFGFAGAALFGYSGLGEQRMRAWLIANADVLPEMATELRQREAQARLADLGPVVVRPFPGAILGNPSGTRTLVKFTDYGCTYCRASEKDVQRLIASDADLKIVVREWPIFEGSEDAARMALAAAAQGKYPAFYKAMFAGEPPSAASVAAAAASAGLDMSKATAFAVSADATAEIAQNMQLARALGFTGTPSWVAEGKVIEGAVGFDRLQEALAAKAGA